MDCSVARLDSIESQRSTGVSNDQGTPGYFPMNLIKKGSRIFSSPSFSQNGGEVVMPPPTVEIDGPPEFLNNLRLSDVLDFPGEYVEMNQELFTEVSDGNTECLEKLRSHETPVACLRSDQGDSVLHLAAFWGHTELVKSMVSECPSLLLIQNSKDQLPLHVAAHGGHSDVVEALIATLTFVAANLSEEEREKLNLYVVKDKDGDTPLHLALKGNYNKIASSLVNANHQASFLANKKGISPLYLAVKVRDISLVQEIINTTGNDSLEERKSNLDSMLEGRKYLAHAAMKSESTDMLDVILKKYPSLQDERDNKGRSCLSLGASKGLYSQVRNLLKRSTKSVYECDDDGSFPIHIAAKEGHVRIIDAILKHCPGAKHLENRRGQNILHIAANFGKCHLVRSLMRDDGKRQLIVVQDLDGNTPLHLATINWCSDSVRYLTSDENTLQLRNNSGLRAQDIAVTKSETNYIFQERLTLGLLLYAVHKSGRSEEPIKSITKPSQPVDNDYVNTVLLVAALVATMTFGAGFTIPGGFNSSGRATLASNPTLVLFLLLDTFAMQCSFATIATLIWAQLGDPELVRTSLEAALPLMTFALLTMPLAFLFGLVTAIGHSKWLLAIICILSYIFFYWVFYNLGTHVMLQKSNVTPEAGGNQLELFLIFKDFVRQHVGFWGGRLY